MRILVCGGTGFLGRHLVRALTARGDTLTILSRDRARAHSQLTHQSALGIRNGLDTRPLNDARGGGRSTEGESEHLTVVEWDPMNRDAELDIAGVDAVVNLSGAPAVGQRWTPAVKRDIRESRVASTQALVAAMGRTTKRPKAFICASAVGYYGGRDGDEILDEDASGGSDFLATVCQAWEDAAEEASAFGVRVVRARIGVVLGPEGGALEELVKPFKVYAGGPIGSGRQVVSWIHLDDLIRSVTLCIDDTRLIGAVNLTAPKPVTNGELARELGRVLRRPAWVPVPAAALRLRFGEGAEPLLTGQRVLPRRLERVGYQWRFSDVRAALRDLLS